MKVLTLSWPIVFWRLSNDSLSAFTLPAWFVTFWITCHSCFNATDIHKAPNTPVIFSSPPCSFPSHLIAPVLSWFSVASQSANSFAPILPVLKEFCSVSACFFSLSKLVVSHHSLTISCLDCSIASVTFLNCRSSQDTSVAPLFEKFFNSACAVVICSLNLSRLEVIVTCAVRSPFFSASFSCDLSCFCSTFNFDRSMLNFNANSLLSLLFSACTKDDIWLNACLSGLGVMIISVDNFSTAIYLDFLENNFLFSSSLFFIHSVSLSAILLTNCHSLLPALFSYITQSASHINCSSV